MMETDDFLEHFGVKGMKWGVRKSKSSYNDFATTYDNFSAGKKAVSALTGFGAAHVTSKFLVNKGYNIPVSIIGGIAAGFAGQNFVQNRLK